MIYGVDTNAFSRALAGIRDDFATRLRRVLRDNAARLPPVVVTELLSTPGIGTGARRLILSVPRLEVLDGYWERAGLLRSELLQLRLKANLADALIAQSCIDHDIPLITYDRDFRHFVRAGLKLA